MKMQIDTENKMVWVDGMVNIQDLSVWLCDMFDNDGSDYLLSPKKLFKNIAPDAILQDFYVRPNTMMPWHDPAYIPTIIDGDEMWKEVSKTYDYELLSVSEGQYVVEFLSV